MLDVGFGLGDKFLAAWDAWQHDPQRCDRLFFVALAPHPPRRDDLARVHAYPHRHEHAQARSALPTLAAALVQAWPPLTANLHELTFDAGRVRLLLGFGEVGALLTELDLRADAFFIDPSARLPWDRRHATALARVAAAGATLVASHAVPGLRNSLQAAGFEIDRVVGEPSDTPLRARYAPRFVPRSLPRDPPRNPPRSASRSASPSAAQPPAQNTPTHQEALVIGAGLAGAAVAAALADLGWAVQVIDRHHDPASETSGNPAGIYHGTLHPGDGPHARLFRAAALAAQRCFEPLIASGTVPGGSGGLLRLQPDSGPLGAGGVPIAMQSLIDGQRLPPDYVQALSAAAASVRAGVPLPGPAWWYPGGGWLSPAALVRAWLQTPGVAFKPGVDVAAIQPGCAGWMALDAEGRCVASASVLVLANAADAQRLLAPLGAAAWPLRASRGQVSGWHGGAAGLRLPVAGDGYALPLSADSVLCGATVSMDDPEPGPRQADDSHNFARLLRLTGLLPPSNPSQRFSRVGWRLQADDRLPVVGAVALSAAQHAPGARLDQPRFVPRWPGLFVLTALGARGITLAPLMGALLAARIAGTPSPLERELADAVDPARWMVRAARRQLG